MISVLNALGKLEGVQHSMWKRSLALGELINARMASRAISCSAASCESKSPPVIHAGLNRFLTASAIGFRSSAKNVLQPQTRSKASKALSAAFLAAILETRPVTYFRIWDALRDIEGRASYLPD